MSAGKHHIVIEQGSTFEMTLSLDEPAGTNKDLTGWSFRGQIKKSAYADGPSATFSMIDLDLPNGIFKAVLSASVTTGMDVGIETYDVEMEHIDGTVIRLLQGRVTIASEVTT
jgi:hypothetical protein